MLDAARCYKRRLCTAAPCNDLLPPATFLYNLLVNDPTYLVQNLTEYFSAVMCLVLTFLCWRLDWQGRANVITKASYVGLVCLLLLIMALPSIGL
jgi:hypothetical protein